MFHTHENSEVKIIDAIAYNGEKTWWYVTKKLHVSWFHIICELTYEANEKFQEIYLIDQVEHLLDIEKNPAMNIIEVDLVSPSYMNGTKRWEMMPLAKIIEGKEPEYQQPVNIFVLANGKHYLESGAQYVEQEIIEPRTIFKVKNSSNKINC